VANFLRLHYGGKISVKDRQRENYILQQLCHERLTMDKYN